MRLSILLVNNWANLQNCVVVVAGNYFPDRWLPINYQNWCLIFPTYLCFCFTKLFFYLNTVADLRSYFWFYKFNSWCVFLPPSVELRYLTIYIPDPLNDYTLAHNNKHNNAGSILLTEDGKRASCRNFVFEPNMIHPYFSNLRICPNYILKKNMYSYLHFLKLFLEQNWYIDFSSLFCPLHYVNMYWVYAAPTPSHLSTLTYCQILCKHHFYITRVYYVRQCNFQYFPIIFQNVITLV
jgi:hypothetical protein